MKKMKQWLLLLAGIAAVIGAVVFPAWAKADLALVADNGMVPADATEWALADKELLLIDVGTQEAKHRELMNLSTGERIPLTLDKEYVPPYTRAFRENPERVLLASMQYLNQVYNRNDRYFWMGVPGVYGLVVDKTNGVAQEALNQISGVTPWGDMYFPLGFSGAGVCTMDKTSHWEFELKDHDMICGVYPLENGFLIASVHEGPHFSLTGPNPAPNEFICQTRLTFTDKQLNTESVILLDGTYFVERRFCCFQCPDTGTILFSTDSEMGVLLLTPARVAYALVSKDNTLKLVPHENTNEIRNGLWEARDVRICGVSDDDGYALVIWKGYGLYKIDLRSLAVTQQMTAAELEAIGLNSNRCYWPGGEYLTDGDDNLYRLVDRSEQNQGM